MDIRINLIVFFDLRIDTMNKCLMCDENETGLSSPKDVTTLYTYHEMKSITIGACTYSDVTLFSVYYFSQKVCR
jgi:hypothetical protein